MDIYKIKLEKDDVILVEIDPEKIALDTAKTQLAQIYNIFPNNTAVVYLKGTKLHFCKEKDIDYLGEWDK